MTTKPKTHQPVFKVAAPLLTRAATFLVAFVVLSGTLGPHIISHGLVDKDGFQIYGGAGKALLFGLLALALLAWRRGFDVSLPAWRPYNASWFVLMFVCVIGAWVGVDALIAHKSGVAWPLLTHGLLLLSVVFAAVGSFGVAGLRALYRKYRRELLITLLLAVAFYGFLYAVYGLWQVLSATVMYVVHWLLGIVGLQSAILPPRTLLFDKFGIEIAQYCSGIESIALFTALYALVGVLDWPRFNHHRFFGLFMPGLLILFACNILRVAVLILAGYYINPHIAFSLFHTYAGMIFFILYSAVFWAISYRWLTLPHPGPKAASSKLSSRQ